MPKFRKKPVVIEAFQWFPEMGEVGGVVNLGNASSAYPHEDKWSISTLEGWLNVSPGDYLITGVKGERYPCKPDIFELTYEYAGRQPE